jgi:hypothetical protein
MSQAMHLWKPPLYLLARGFRVGQGADGKHFLDPDTEIVSPKGEDGEHRPLFFTSELLAQDYLGHIEEPNGLECVPVPSIPHFVWLLRQFDPAYSAIFLDLSPETHEGTEFEIASVLSDLTNFRAN